MMRFLPVMISATPALAGLLWSLLAPVVLANEQRLINVELTVLAKPCTINNGNPIDVAFGDGLLTTRVLGRNYRRTVFYTTRCAAPHLKTGIMGTGASFDTTLLATSNPNLGIQFISASVSQPLNVWHNLNDDGGSATLLYTEAVLVRKPDAPLTPGPFTASATLRVEYQ